MAGVQPLKVEDGHWRVMGEAMPEDRRHGLSEGELLSEVCVHQIGTEDTPQLIQIKFPPNAMINPHAHEENEIIFVLAGELRLGNDILRAGSSVAVGGDTIYAFQAGPEGLEILNFRPRIDLTYMTRAEALERRRKAG